MEELALVLILVTMGGGVLLALLWNALGGARQPEGRGPTHGKIAAHASMAIVAAVIWAMYVAGGEDELGYDVAGPVGLAALVVVVGFGLWMFTGWMASRREAKQGVDDHLEANRRLPALPVLAHGALAAATVVVAAVALLD